MAPFIDRVRLGALLRLRAKLTWRQFTREPGRLLFGILVIVGLLPIVLGLGIATAAGYLFLPDPWPPQLLGGVLVALWLIWLTFPFFIASLNESLDLRRLLVYPLRRRELVAGTLLGTLFDYPTYFMVPLFIAVLVGWATSPALPVVLLALLLAYGHMMLISQLVMAVLGGILQSRRFRDVAIILGSLLGSSCYFLQTGFQRLVDRLPVGTEAERLLDLRPLDTLQWLPTGAAARAVEQASSGRWGMALLWLLYSAVWLALITWSWWRLLNRLATGEGFLIGAPAVRQVAPERPVKQERRWFLDRFLPADLSELTVKEIKTMWRTPQRRVGLLQTLIFPFFMIGAILFSSESALVWSPWSGIALPFYALFIFWANSQNTIGMEGPGLAMLSLTPVRRDRLIWAKGLAILLTSGLLFLVISLVMVGVTRSWQSVTGLVTGLAIGLATLAVCGVFSVLFPIPVDLENRRAQNALTAGGSCLATFASLFIIPPAVALVSAPAALPLIAAAMLNRPWIAFAGLPLSLAYGLALFWLGGRLAGHLLLPREADIIQTIRRLESKNR